MIVTLDGHKVEREFEVDATLQQIIDQVRDEQCGPRLVVGVSIDGGECDADDLTRRLDASVDGVGQIDLESGDPRDLAAHALRMIAEQMRTLGQAQIKIAEQINVGDVVQAMPQISQFVGAWQTVQQVIVQVANLTGRDVAADEFDGQPIGEHLAALLGQLRDIRDALESRDLVALADLLQYETPAMCETWSQLLSELADSFRSAPTTP